MIASRKRKILIAVLGMILAAKGSVMAEDLAKRSFDRWPRVMLFITDPWRAVIGSDSPCFALYENGLVVFRSQSAEAPYSSVQLSPEKKEELLKQLWPGPDFFTLPDYIEADPLKTDQPTNIISLRSGDSFRAVRVYGNLHRNSSVRAAAPKSFVNLFDRITAYSHEQAATWQPDFIEIMLWPFENSAMIPADWPSNWPRLQDLQKNPRGSGGYSVYLPSHHFQELKELLRSMGSGQSLLLEGKKWAVAYRLPFPHEVPAPDGEKRSKPGSSRE